MTLCRSTTEGREECAQMKEGTSRMSNFAHVKVCHMTEEESDGEGGLIVHPISWRSNGSLFFLVKASLKFRMSFEF